MCSKEEVQSKINSKEYSLRKRNILSKDVESGKKSAIWLFMREIYKTPVVYDVSSVKLILHFIIDKYILNM